MKHTKRTLKRMAAIMVAFAVAFTITPMISGDMTVHAATAKKPAKVGSLRTSATTQTTITLKWNKVKTKGTKGYVVYRYVPSAKKWLKVKDVKKATTLTFKDQNLKAGTSYKYRVRAYTTYKQYYNTKTKKWVNKRPVKKQWKTKKSRTRYKWGAYSDIKTFKTKPATKPSDKDSVFTKSSISGTTKLTLDSNGYDYTVNSSGSVTWSVNDKGVAEIASTFASSKNTTRIATLNFKKAGTVTLKAKSSLNGKEKTLSITVKSTSSGGGTPIPTTSPRTKYSCTNYLGRAFTLWKDSDGNFWDSESGGTKISSLAAYDKTVDGTWTSGGHNFIQQGGVTAGGIYYNQDYMGTAEIKIYNGTASRAKFVVRENTKKYLSAEGDDFGQTFVLDSAGNRITAFSSDSAMPNVIKFKHVTSDFGYDGFVDGTVHVNGYYDFNNNGILTDDELVGSREILVESTYGAQRAYEIAQDAVNYYGTSSYEADMAAINAYVFRTYKQTEKLEGTNIPIGTCIGGANILKAWSIKKYKVYGAVYTAPGYEAHEEFYPEANNSYTRRERFGADGHNYTQGQTPGSDSYNRELARREADVAEYMAAGK